MSHAEVFIDDVNDGLSAVPGQSPSTIVAHSITMFNLTDDAVNAFAIAFRSAMTEHVDRVHPVHTDVKDASTYIGALASKLLVVYKETDSIDMVIQELHERLLEMTRRATVDPITQTDAKMLSVIRNDWSSYIGTLEHHSGNAVEAFEVSTGRPFRIDVIRQITWNNMYRNVLWQRVPIATATRVMDSLHSFPLNFRIQTKDIEARKRFLSRDCRADIARCIKYQFILNSIYMKSYRFIKQIEATSVSHNALLGICVESLKPFEKINRDDYPAPQFMQECVLKHKDYLVLQTYKDHIGSWWGHRVENNLVPKDAKDVRKSMTEKNDAMIAALTAELERFSDESIQRYFFNCCVEYVKTILWRMTDTARALLSFLSGLRWNESYDKDKDHDNIFGALSGRIETMGKHYDVITRTITNVRESLEKLGPIVPLDASDEDQALRACRIWAAIDVHMAVKSAMVRTSHLKSNDALVKAVSDTVSIHIKTMQHTIDDEARKTIMRMMELIGAPGGKDVAVYNELMTKLQQAYIQFKALIISYNSHLDFNGYTLHVIQDWFAYLSAQDSTRTTQYDNVMNTTQTEAARLFRETRHVKTRAIIHSRFSTRYHDFEKDLLGPSGLGTCTAHVNASAYATTKGFIEDMTSSQSIPNAGTDLNKVPLDYVYLQRIMQRAARVIFFSLSLTPIEVLLAWRIISFLAICFIYQNEAQ